MKQTFILSHNTARLMAVRALQNAPHGHVITISEPTRSLEQNAAQWPVLQAFADQRELCINGKMVKVTADDWKDVLTACWDSEMRMAAFDGKVIMLPKRTSTMGKKTFSSWYEYLIAMAAQCGVVVYEEYA